MDAIFVRVYSLSRGAQWSEDAQNGGVFFLRVLLGDAPGGFCVARGNRWVMLT